MVIIRVRGQAPHIAEAVKTAYSPTEQAEREQQESKRFRGDIHIMRGNQHQRTRRAHGFCPHGTDDYGPVGCGAQAHEPGAWAETKHEHCATGCGTHSKGKCGGRAYAHKYPASMFSKTDATMRIAVGNKRAATWRAKLRGERSW